MPSKRVIVGLLLWLLLATVFTALGGLRLALPPFPQAILVGLTVALFVARFASGTFRVSVDAISVAWLVAIHLSRFVGFYFLVLYERGELPYAFAVPGGWGDIVVALAALLLLITRGVGLTAHSRLVQGWNLLGLIDILLVVLTAARLALQSPASMAPLLELPLGLLPTFLVPLIIFTHAVLLFRGRPSAA